MQITSIALEYTLHCKYLQSSMASHRRVPEFDMKSINRVQLEPLSLDITCIYYHTFLYVYSILRIDPTTTEARQDELEYDHNTLELACHRSLMSQTRIMKILTVPAPALDLLQPKVEGNHEHPHPLPELNK